MSTTKLLDREIAALRSAFPYSLRQEVDNAIRVLPPERDFLRPDGGVIRLDNLIGPTERTVSVNGELLIIPDRVYFNEPQAYKELKLTRLERTILNCIYLKHNDGYVRQRQLMQMIADRNYFVIPYTIHLLGEYVLEILEVLDQHVNNETIDNYAKFVGENKGYWRTTERRIISYWNEYYRSFPFLEGYAGKKVFDRINEHTQSVSINCGS